MRGILFFCLVFASLSTAHAAAPPLEWLPQESWPGGKQYDARLEKPVRFWAPGMPLAEVFGKVREQTGVEVRFFPPDDVNARVCVNIFLSSDQPPTLRELLVQLSWAMDCAFGYETEAGTAVYSLLSTSSGSGALEKLAEQAKGKQSQASGDDWRRRFLLRPKAVARLQEVKAALTLSREDAIRTYRGKDDLLLLAVLDPGRRAMVQLLTSLPAEDLDPERVGPIGMKVYRMSALTPAQLALLKEAAAQAIHAHSAEPLPADWSAVAARLPSLVWSYQNAGTGFEFQIDTLPGDPQPLTLVFPFLLLLPEQGTGEQNEISAAAELAGFLGEATTPAERAKLVGELRSQRQAWIEKECLEKQISWWAPLSAEMQTRLNALPAPSEPRRRAGLSLWQLQEFTAETTGLNVVSDAFWQPPRPGPSRASSPDGGPQPTLLSALRTACAGSSLSGDMDFGPDTLRLQLAAPTGRERDWERSLSWEWGEAGSFLHFRSNDRALFREAFLPEEIVQALNDWVQPHLPAPEAGQQPQPDIAVPLDVRACAAVIAKLSPAQVRWGGFLIYSDPSDQHTLYSRLFRERFFQELASEGGRAESGPTVVTVYRALADLSDQQWQQLTGEGLAWEVEFTIRPGWEDGSPPPEWPYQRGDLFRLRGPLSAEQVKGEYEGIWSDSCYRLEVVAGATGKAEYAPLDLPAEIQVFPLPVVDSSKDKRGASGP